MREFYSKEQIITPMEADVIIINEIGVINGHFAADNEYPTKVDGRTIRVAHAYLNARRYVNRALELAGLKELKVSLKF